MRRPKLPLLFFVIVLLPCWSRLKALPEPRFATGITTPLPVTFPAMLTENVQPNVQPIAPQLLPPVGASAHAVSLTQLGDGRVIAAWYAGSREGADDVAIVSATYGRSTWSAPITLVNRHDVQRDVRRLIRKIGNPVLWRAADNVLHLWFVSVSYGGWAGSAINHMQSNDNGQHWSAATRIVTSPFWNLSTLVRNPPLVLADGGVALPVYHEFINKRPEWLRFSRDGALVDKTRVPGSAHTLQPAAVALDQHRALMLLRDSGPLHRIHSTHSSAAGDSWQPALATPLPNPDSAIALLRLHDGSLLLACNLLEANRNQLVLLRSGDEGRRWSLPLLVEQGNVDDEFSYPALLQDNAGNVHLAYTWQRQSIRHMAIPAEKLEAMP
jgi:predicted neuraminidase